MCPSAAAKIMGKSYYLVAVLSFYSKGTLEPRRGGSVGCAVSLSQDTLGSGVAETSTLAMDLT